MEVYMHIYIWGLHRVEGLGFSKIKGTFWGIPRIT